MPRETSPDFDLPASQDAEPIPDPGPQEDGGLIADDTDYADADFPCGYRAAPGAPAPERMNP